MEPKDREAELLEELGYDPLPGHITAKSQLTLEETIQRNVDTALEMIDKVHSDYLVHRAEVQESIRNLLGENYPKYAALQMEQESLETVFQRDKEKVRKEVINPAVMAYGRTATSKYYRVVYMNGKETVDRQALREWAKETGNEAAVEAYITLGNAFSQLKAITKVTGS